MINPKYIPSLQKVKSFFFVFSLLDFFPLTIIFIYFLIFRVSLIIVENISLLNVIILETKKPIDDVTIWHIKDNEKKIPLEVNGYNYKGNYYYEGLFHQLSGQKVEGFLIESSNENISLTAFFGKKFTVFKRGIPLLKISDTSLSKNSILQIPKNAYLINKPLKYIRYFFDFLLIILFFILMKTKIFKIENILLVCFFLYFSFVPFLALFSTPRNIFLLGTMYLAAFFDLIIAITLTIYFYYLMKKRGLLWKSLFISLTLYSILVNTHFLSLRLLIKNFIQDELETIQMFFLSSEKRKEIVYEHYGILYPYIKFTMQVVPKEEKIFFPNIGSDSIYGNGGLLRYFFYPKDFGSIDIFSISNEQQLFFYSKEKNIKYLYA